MCKKSEAIVKLVQRIKGDPETGVVGGNEETVNRKFGKSQNGQQSLERTMSMMNVEVPEGNSSELDLSASIMTSAAEQKEENEKEEVEESLLKGMENSIERMVGALEKFGDGGDDELIYGEEVIDCLVEDVVHRDVLVQMMDEKKNMSRRKIKMIQRAEQKHDVVTTRRKKREFVEWLKRMEPK